MDKVELREHKMSNNKHIKVSVIPNHPSGLNNQIFNRNYPLNTAWQGNTHWMDSNIALYEECIKHNIHISTKDLLPPEQADVVLHFDLPQGYNNLLALKNSAPKAKLILFLQESPFLPYWFNKENHSLFDLVLTYNQTLVDNKKYHKIFLPISYTPSILAPNNWQDRKKCIVLQSNIYTGVKASRTPLHYLARLHFFYSQGWKFSWKDVLSTDRNLLYEQRRRFVKKFYTKYVNSLDVYGRGWEGKSDGWFYKIFPDRPYPANSSVYQGEKLELLQKYRFVLAFENYKGDEGYISEKIFDALYAGAIPIYLGDKKIDSWVDPRCFVDARKFKSLDSLVDFIHECDECTWNTMRYYADQYIMSEKIKLFLPYNYTTTIFKAINYVLS
jgi:hypothetical protein